MKPCSEIMTPREYAAVYEEVTGISVNVVSLSREKFMEMGETGVLPPDEWAKYDLYLYPNCSDVLQDEMVSRYWCKYPMHQVCLYHISRSVRLENLFKRTS